MLLPFGIASRSVGDLPRELSQRICRACALATSDAAKVLGLERLDVIRSMESTFDEWEGNWLGHAMPAAWFANILTTESGRILIPNGIVRFAKVVGAFADS
jgi:hypothetical protein